MNRQLALLAVLLSVAMAGCKNTEPAEEPVTTPDSAPAANFGIGPVLRATAGPATEGDSGETILVVTLVLSPPARTSVSVEFITAGGTAEEGIDYRRTKGRWEFKPGEKQKTIEIPIIADDIAEEDESFRLRLHIAEGATLAAPELELRILDDD